MCGQLIEQMQQKHLLTSPSKVSDSVIASLYQYGRAFLKLFSDKNYPDKDHATTDEIKEVLSDILLFKEAFITPGDLLSNTTNLMDMGELTYTDAELDEYMKKN